MELIHRTIKNIRDNAQGSVFFLIYFILVIILLVKTCSAPHLSDIEYEDLRSEKPQTLFDYARDLYLYAIALVGLYLFSYFSKKLWELVKKIFSRI